MEGDTEPPLSNINDHYDVILKMIFEDTKFPKWKCRERSAWLKVRHYLRIHWYAGFGAVMAFLAAATAIIYNIVNTFMK